MSKRKLFCFGYYFPPSRAPEAIVSAKRTVGLKGWDVTFAAFQLSEEDQELADYVHRKFDRVVRLPLPWWICAIPRPVLNRLPFLPDWLSVITKYAAGRLKEHQVSENHVFMTCSQSHSSHLVGLEIKKSYPQLPWVAHFSDPWASNPYVSVERQQKERKLEAAVFKNADLLIFTSEETRDHVSQEYPNHIRSKMRVLPHSYDPDMWKRKGVDKIELPREGKKRILIRHIGALYGKRSPITFIEALVELTREIPELLDSVSFEFIGPIDEEFRSAFTEKGFTSEFLSLCPSVNYLDSLQLMKNADALLVIDAPAEKNIFLPSKLIDYVGTGKPILALSPSGTTKSLVESYGGHCCNPDDVGQIVQELQSFLTKLSKASTSIENINEVVRSQYHVDKVGEILQTYLNEVTPESID